MKVRNLGRKSLEEVIWKLASLGLSLRKEMCIRDRCWRSFGKKRGCESMSRIGRKPINIPAGFEVTVNGSEVAVKGPKGTLNQTFNSKMNIAVEGNEILVTRPDDEKESRSLHGLTRTLIHNMVVGVTEGFSKTLEVQGVGYRVQKQGKDLVMNLGYSHQVIVSDTDDIKIEAPNANTIAVSYTHLDVYKRQTLTWTGTACMFPSAM